MTTLRDRENQLSGEFAMAQPERKNGNGNIHVICRMGRAGRKLGINRTDADVRTNFFKDRRPTRSFVYNGQYEWSSNITIIYGKIVMGS